MKVNKITSNRTDYDGGIEELGWKKYFEERSDNFYLFESIENENRLVSIEVHDEFDSDYPHDQVVIMFKFSDKKGDWKIVSTDLEGLLSIIQGIRNKNSLKEKINIGSTITLV